VPLKADRAFAWLSLPDAAGIEKVFGRKGG